MVLMDECPHCCPRFIKGLSNNFKLKKHMHMCYFLKIVNREERTMQTTQ